MKTITTMSLMTILSIGIFILSFAPSAFAKTPDEIRNELRNNRQEFATSQQGLRMERREEVKEKVASRVGAIKAFFGARVSINNAKVIAKGNNTLTIEKDAKTYTVTINDKTRIRRRYFGEATFGDILIGHIITVSGKYADDAHTVIDAVLVRDISIQKRHAVFVGDVMTVAGNDITINSLHRGSQKISVSATTKFINRKTETIALGDIAVGHKIRVKGMWDSAYNTVTEVTNVKDFSLPVKPVPTVMPTSTPTL